MALTALAVQQISRSGLNPSFTAANADGHTVVNNGNTTFVYVTNGAAAPITVTFDITQTVDGVTPAAKSVTVTNGQSRIIGPFPKSIYDQAGADAGKIHMHFSDVATITCAAFQL